MQDVHEGEGGRWGAGAPAGAPSKPAAGRAMVSSGMGVEIQPIHAMIQRYPYMLMDAVSSTSSSSRKRKKPSASSRRGGGSAAGGVGGVNADADALFGDGPDDNVTPAEFYQPMIDECLPDKTENPNAIPALHRLWSRMGAMAPTPAFALHPGIGTQPVTMEKLPTASELTDMLRERKFVSLPVCNALHENELLVQADVPRQLPSGDTVMPPACKNGALCEGLAGEIRGAPLDSPQGFKLMGYLWPEELRVFQSTGLAPRGQARLCVLCSRIAFFDMVHAIHAQRTHISVDRDYCFQMFRNPVTGVGAYREDVMMPPPAEEWFGFCDLVVCHQRDKLRWRYDSTLKLWRIDQSPLIASTFPSGAATNMQQREEEQQDGRAAVVVNKGRPSNAPVQRPTPTSTPPAKRAKVSPSPATNNTNTRTTALLPRLA